MAYKKVGEPRKPAVYQKVTRIDLRPGLFMKLVEKGYSENARKTVAGGMQICIDLREFKERDSAIVHFAFSTSESHTLASRIQRIVK